MEDRNEPIVSQTSQLVEALAAAKLEFEPVTKTGRVDVRSEKGKYSYTYSTLDDIAKACDQALAKHGLAVVHHTNLEDGQLVLVSELMHISGEKICNTFPVSTEAAGMIKGIQAIGARLTYLKRYAKTNLLDLTAEEDDDAQRLHGENGGSGPGSSPGKDKPGDSVKPLPDYRKWAFALAKDMGWDDTQTAEYFKTHCPEMDGSEVVFKTVGSRKDFTDENWKLLCKHLKALASGSESPNLDDMPLPEAIAVVAPLLHTSSDHVAMWLEAQYVVDIDKPFGDKEKAIRKLLKILATDKAVADKATADVKRAVAWYRGKPAAREMIHILADQRSEVLDAFLQHVGASKVREMSPEAVANWQQYLDLAQTEGKATPPEEVF